MTAEEILQRYPDPAQHPEFSVVADALRTIENRFIEERINGFNHPGTKQFVPPASQEEVLARWVKARPAYAAALLAKLDDPAYVKRFAWKRPATSEVEKLVQ